MPSKPAAGNPPFDGLIIDESCLGCGLCRERCPAGAIEIRGGKYGIGPACRGCLACLEVCPAAAVIITEYD